MNTENKLKIDDFTKALAECINQAQCAVVDPMAHAEIWKEELLELAKGKEPVSEDLEATIDTYLATYFGGEKEKRDWPFLKKMAIHFANWQKKKDDYAIEIAHMAGEEEGKNIMKQQMMVKAIDVTIAIPYPNCDCGYTQLVYSNKALPFGENIKVLVIKED